MTADSLREAARQRARAHLESRRRQGLPEIPPERAELLHQLQRDRRT